MRVKYSAIAAMLAQATDDDNSIPAYSPEDYGPEDYGPEDYCTECHELICVCEDGQE